MSGRVLGGPGRRSRPPGNGAVPSGGEESLRLRGGRGAGEGGPEGGRREAKWPRHGVGCLAMGRGGRRRGKQSKVNE